MIAPPRHLVQLSVAANAAAADFSSSSNLIPNPDVVYQSTNAVDFAGDFTKDYNVLSIVLRAPSGGAPPPFGNSPPVIDIFTELSLDGGQTWAPASGPIHLESVPEPSSVVLAALGVAGLVAWGWRRRKR